MSYCNCVTLTHIPETNTPNIPGKSAAMFEIETSGHKVLVFFSYCVTHLAVCVTLFFILRISHILIISPRTNIPI